ncbi:MAG TPA: carboxypeptidase-like regulatory domain-containing protein [Flavobacteriales bacterium]|nr:carboxypeptidase-like regulatory domain-containing protein [Flavobacteriales bacterium]
MIMRILALFLFTAAFDHAFAQDSLRVQLYGSVLHAISGTPIHEALVEWYDGNGKRQAVTQTNSEGHYALFVSSGQPIELRVKENGYEPFVGSVPPFEPGESARELDLRLVPE